MSKETSLTCNLGLIHGSTRLELTKFKLRLKKKRVLMPFQLGYTRGSLSLEMSNFMNK
jgi:hypothetical protein